MKKIILFSLLCALTVSVYAAKEVEEPTRFEYKMGMQAYEGGDFRMAWDYLRQDAYLNQKSGWTQARLAFMLVSASGYKQALTSAEDAVKLLSPKAKIYPSICVLAGVLQENLNADTTAAMTYYKKAVKAAPDSLDAYLAMADIYFAKGQFKANEKHLQKTIRVAPEKAMPHLHACRNYISMNNYLRAIQEGRKACELDSLSAQNFSFLASAEMGMEYYTLASQNVARALELDRSYERAQHQATYLFVKNYEGMANTCFHMGEKYPEDDFWMTLIAQGSVDRSEYIKAEAADSGRPLSLEDTIELAKLQVHGIMYGERALERVKVDSVGVAAYFEALENESDSVEAYRYYGQSGLYHRDAIISFVATRYILMGEYAESLEYYKELIAPTALDYYNIACCYSMLNESGKALQALEKSCDEGYHNAEWALQDTDLKNISGLPEFQRIIDKMRAEAPEK